MIDRWESIAPNFFDLSFVSTFININQFIVRQYCELFFFLTFPHHTTGKYWFAEQIRSPENTFLGLKTNLRNYSPFFLLKFELNHSFFFVHAWLSWVIGNKIRKNSYFLPFYPTPAANASFIVSLKCVVRRSWWIKPSSSKL